MLPLMTFEGTVGRDPEVRFTPSGKAVASFSVVANERKRGDDGKWVDGDATWMNVTCWERLAENVADTLKKGHAVIVVGRLRQRSYETKEGEKKTVFELRADNIGPSIKWDPAEVKKAERKKAAASDEDPWASAPAQDDAPPF